MKLLTHTRTNLSEIKYFLLLQTTTLYLHLKTTYVHTRFNVQIF